MIVFKNTQLFKMVNLPLEGHVLFFNELFKQSLKPNYVQSSTHKKLKNIKIKKTLSTFVQ